MRRLLALLVAVLALAWSPAVSAKVAMTFHSFNGSVLFGRYPHTFVSLDGTLEANGQRVHENFGWSARSASPAVLAGPVAGVILTEKDKWLSKTNRHFTVTLDDAAYWKVRRKVEFYRDQPGRFYSLETNNCIHFIGAIAQVAGLTVDYPHTMLRRPREWLNHVAALNPQLGAKQI